MQHEPRLPRFNPSFYSSKFQRQRLANGPGWLERQRRRAYREGFLSCGLIVFVALITIRVMMVFQ